MAKNSIAITPGPLKEAYGRALRRGERADLVGRIMRREAAVFTKKSDLRKSIANRLGWVDSATSMKRRLSNIEKFGDSVIRAGLMHVVLMGMGGSSLCPDLFRLVAGHHPKLKSFDVIDSTDPAAIRALTRKIDPKKTLFIVASKSGSTVETRSHQAYFEGLLKDLGVRNFGRHFCAITDKGSALDRYGRRSKYRKVFRNPSDIGGRFSALSYFGLVPGFFAGIDLRALVDSGAAMQKILNERSGETNPALALGTLMAIGSRDGRNKLTFIASRKTGPLVPWIEQLVAESTGKKGRGVIPIEGELPARPDEYARDRLFVFVRTSREKHAVNDRMRREVQKRRFPTVDIVLDSITDLGGQFLLWEAATAVAGWHLKINPFDEPNVTESKNNTKNILSGFERSGEFPDQDVSGRYGKLSLVACGGPRRVRPVDQRSLSALLKRFFTGARPPEYFAALGYLKSDRRTEAAMAEIRRLVAARTRMSTLRGYGPRYLHSVGQLYKGGPGIGRFVVFVKGHYGHLPIPERKYEFGQLIAAQAIGDAQALMKRKFPTLVFAIDGSPAAGLEQFARALKRALRK